MPSSLPDNEPKQAVNDKLAMPTIGILTVSDNRQFFKGNYLNFIDLIKCGQNAGALVYVVTTDDLKLTEPQITGFTYDFNRKTWVREWVPLPKVIYNRVPTRSQEMMPQVQQKIKSCLRNKRVKLFNPSFFNKWTLFEWLGDLPETKRYVPSTFQLSAQSELDMMLMRYPLIYLKPVRGKAGKGIMRIERRTSQIAHPIYRLTMQDHKTTRQSLHTSTDTLWSKIQDSRKSEEEYIIQQGIDLVKYRERPYDLRVLIQKANKGEWSVTGIGARLAGAYSITTHVPRGGSIEDPEKLLTLTFGPVRAKQILQQTKQTALFLAKHIEKKSGDALGEMSMDLGIDTTGRSWFFEANSKPAKFDEPHIRDKSLEKLIAYSIYLTKSGKRR
jgi:hypothetical protein